MVIKICGLRQKNNILNISTLAPDYYGLIFYDKSPRYVSDSVNDLPNLPFVGVFVNATIDTIVHKIKQYQLVAVQLHGNETPDFILSFQKELEKNQLSIKIFKAFGVSQHFDFQQLIPYENICQLFIFDTKTPVHGGSGEQYDWQILDNYFGKTPFLLSGGIGVEDAVRIKQFQHPQFAGVDLNSRFEISPALKDIEKLQQFKQILNS